MSNEKSRNNANVASGDSEQHARRECDQVRRSIQQKLRDAVQQDGLIMSRQVMELTMKDLQESKMKEYGAKDYETQLEWLRTSEKEDTPKTINQAKQYAAMFRDLVSAAKKEGGLTEKNEKSMIKKIKDHNGDWIQVHAFFEKDETQEGSLQYWARNWKKVAADLKEVEKKRRKLEFMGGTLPDSVKDLEKPDFKDGKVKLRLKMLDTALIDLIAAEHGHTQTYANVQGQIRRAVRGEAVAAHNVDLLVKSIYQRHPKDIAEYSENVLPGYVDDWILDAQIFLLQSENAANAGMPVMSFSQYLEMGYKDRTAETARLQKALKGAERASRHPVIIQVQEALDAENFKGAKALADKAALQQLSDGDRNVLNGLRRQIDMETEADAMTAHDKGKLTPREDVMKKRAALEAEMRKLPPELFNYYAWALQQGGPHKWARLRRLRVWHYNVKWAHSHGFLNNEKDLQRVKDGAEEETELINEHGHRQKGVQRMNLGKLDTSKQIVDRPIASGKARGATYITFGKEDMEKLQKVTNTDLTDEKVNYWGLGVAENVTLKKHLETYDAMAPILRGLQTAEVAAGMQDESIDVGYGMAA